MHKNDWIKMHLTEMFSKGDLMSSSGWSVREKSVLSGLLKQRFRATFLQGVTCGSLVLSSVVESNLQSNFDRCGYGFLRNPCLLASASCPNNSFFCWSHLSPPSPVLF